MKGISKSHDQGLKHQKKKLMHSSKKKFAWMSNEIKVGEHFSAFKKIFAKIKPGSILK